MGNCKLLPSKILEIYVSTLESGDVERVSIPRIVEGEIVAVRCITYLGCTVCKVKVQSVDGTVAECGKCGLMVKMSACRNFIPPI